MDKSPKRVGIMTTKKVSKHDSKLTCDYGRDLISDGTEAGFIENKSR